MARWWMRVGVVALVVAMVAPSGWSQRRGWFGRSMGDTGKYISVILLLDEEASGKVEALCEKEGEKAAEAMQGIWESAGGDREAAMAKMRDEREKYAAQVKTGLGGILSEGQIESIGPVLTGRIPSTFRSAEEGGRNPLLWALAALSLEPGQKTRIVKITVPYAEGIQPFASRRSREAPSQEDQDKIRDLVGSFKTDVAAVLTAGQKQVWEDEAGKLRKQWEDEAEEARQRRQR